MMLMTQSGIEIKLLADCPHCIPQLARLWFEEIGCQWIPGATIEQAKQTYIEHLNNDELPLTVIAIHKNQAIGMISLRAYDGIREDLTPWLGSLVIQADYRKQGLGTLLIEIIKAQAKEMGFDKLYLFVLDASLLEWYQYLGWKKIGVDTFKQHPVIVMESDTEKRIIACHPSESSPLLSR